MESSTSVTSAKSFCCNIEFRSFVLFSPCFGEAACVFMDRCCPSRADPRSPIAAVVAVSSRNKKNSPLRTDYDRGREAEAEEN